MKVHAFVSLLLLATLAGCGGSGGNGSAQLEITRGFATGNANFDGGLYIHGKKEGSTEEFSFALSSAQKASLVLSFGTWTIRAVGWDNTSNVFEGDVNCGLQTVNFQSENQTLQLKVSPAACANSAFASASYIESVEGKPRFKALEAYTCGALYDPANTAQLLPPQLMTSMFCDQYPKTFQKKARGMMISLLNMEPGKKPTNGLSSLCIPVSPTPGTPHLTKKRLPTKIPVAISLFEQENCLPDSILHQYHYPDGMETSLSRAALSFDAVLRSTTSSTMLGLIAEKSRRGTTPFETELPAILCNFSAPADRGNKCLTIPNRPSDTSYVMAVGRNTIRFPGVFDICPDTDINDTDFDVQKCEVREDGTYLTIHLENKAVGETYDINVNGVQHRVLVVNSFNIPPLRDLMRILGYNSNTGDILDSLQDEYVGKDHDEDKSSGSLASAVEILGPGALGGLFWDQVCTTTPLPAPVKRSATFMEDGQLESYQIILMNPPAQNGPRYIVDGSPRSMASINPFHRRFIIRSLITQETESVIDIACDNQSIFGTNNVRIGRMEEHRIDDDDEETTDERRIILWNTSFPNNARYERYTYDKEFDKNLGKVRNIRTTYERVEKYPNATTAQSDLRISRMGYEYYYNSYGSSYQERLHRDEYDVQGLMIAHKHLGGQELTKSNSLTPGTIFNFGRPSELAKVRYGSFESKKNEIKVLPNGKFVRGIYKGGSFRHEIFNGSNYVSMNPSAGTIPDQMAVDMSFDGTKAVVLASTGSNITVFRYNGSWSQGSLSIGTPVIGLKTAIMNNGDYIVLALGDNGLFYYDVLTFSENIPSSILASSIYGNETDDQIFQIELAKTTSHFHIFLNHLNDDTSTFVRNLATCAVNVSNESCATSDIFSESDVGSPDVEIQQFSAANSDSGDKLYVAYTITDNYGLPSSYVSATSTNGTTWQYVTTPAAGIMFNAHQTSESFINTANLIDSYPPSISVDVPYVNPGISGFRHNLNSLNPATMLNSTFTPHATFINIGSGL